MTLRLDRVGVRFGFGRAGAVTALDEVSLEVPSGTFAAVVGPSGCGKSTLLRIAAGLARATTGTASADGVRIEGPSRRRGMVFQTYTLFPWLTVRGNIGFAPALAGATAAARAAVADRFIALVGLDGFADAYPNQLSGGMRQRVALARAFAADPDILLMDEPFGALDSQTRHIMQTLLLEIWERDKKTILFVTHDIDEALLLADVVHVMTARPGRIKRSIQVALARPRTLDSLTTPAFMALKREVLGLIRDEALEAAGATRGE